MANGEVIAQHQITITVSPETAPQVSGFNAVVMDTLKELPSRWELWYYWPSSGGWAGDPGHLLSR